MEGYFFNDLVAFDLNALQQTTNKWEILIQNTIDGGPPHGQIPPARTNHTMVTWGDKLFLFGGTDGVNWFNDVWSYSPQTNSWTQLECIGYIPSPREGHAAALVGDVMYIFGGRTEEGTDLGDLAAFRISSRRWYTFQNMGPSPSPRSGHSMTTVGKQIVVLAGEPSSAPRDPVELSYAYFLDTSKIKYPPDAAPAAAQQQSRAIQNGLPGSRSPTSPRDLQQRERFTSNEDLRARGAEVMRNNSGARLPPGIMAQNQLPAPVGPVPLVPEQQLKPNGIPASRQPSRPERSLSPQADASRAQELNRVASPTGQVPRGGPVQALPSSPSFPPDRSYYDSENSRMYKPDTYQPSQTQAAASKSPVPDADRADDSSRSSSYQTPTARELHEEDDPQDSGIGSSPALTQQHDVMARELESLKKRNAWYASELALARKSGYQSRSTDSPVLDARAPDVFGEDDKPLIEALLAMKAELARVQGTIDSQSKSAAERIAEIEKQRDAAIGEAVYAKTRLAGQGSPQPDGEGKRSVDLDRNSDMSRRLASSLNAQTELSKRIDGLIQELDNEKRARQLAEEHADAAQSRAMELDSSHQSHGTQMEEMRTALYAAQSQAREASASHAEIKSQHDLLAIDHTEKSGQLDRALAETQNHTDILSSLRDAVAASTEKAEMLEHRLEEERGQRSDLEQQLRELQAEHDSRSMELDDTSRRLRDAEELSSKHAEEARTHRGVLLAGLDKVTSRGVDPSAAADERVSTLKQQVESANAMVRQNQAAADTAAEKLRAAEARIAGLESAQQQASRDGLSIRKQLQTVTKEHQELSSKKMELEQKLQTQVLETNAIAVQHASLRDVLSDRGLSAADVRRSRALDSPSSMSRFGTPDLQRMKELEQQLDSSMKSHDEMKQQFEQVNARDETTRREYEEKLAALDNDHQAAVKYLRGTEKMLSKMKQELQRIKDENRDLKKKLDKPSQEGDVARSASSADTPAADWEVERDRLKGELAEVQSHLRNMSELEGRLSVTQQQLRLAEDEIQQVRTRHATAQADFTTLQASHSQTKSDIERLQQQNSSLESRARDAENKVQLLLDQVESSVDNYRRQSRISDAPTMLNGGTYQPSGGNVHSSVDPTSFSTAGHAQHTRGLSDGAYSTATDPTRNSQALDSLASELETLRSHWETTNRSYHRMSDRYDGNEAYSGEVLHPGLDINYGESEEGEEGERTETEEEGHSEDEEHAGEEGYEERRRSGLAVTTAAH